MAFPDFTTLSFTTAVVSAQSVLDIDQVIDATYNVNRSFILKLLITPSESQSNNRFEFWKHSFANSPASPEELLYGTSDFEGVLIEPMEERGLGPTERTNGFVFVQIDGDEDGELHLRITNNHTQDQTYDVEVTYMEFPRVESGQILGLVQGDAAGEPVTADRIIATGTGLTGGGNLTADRTISQVADSVRQLVNVKIDGSNLGTVPILDMKSGLRFSFTGAMNGTTAEITGTASNQVSNAEALQWASLTF